MGQKDNLLVNLPRIITYTTITLLVVLDAFILISTNKYFDYFDEYKQSNDIPYVGMSEIRKEEVEKVYSELDTTNKFSQNQDYDRNAILEGNNYTDIFRTNYNESEIIKYLSK